MLKVGDENQTEIIPNVIETPESDSKSDFIKKNRSDPYASPASKIFNG
jgi:hypothetical protein